jgi:hypothetical protein
VRDELFSRLIYCASGGHRIVWRSSASHDRSGLIQPALRPFLMLY